MNQPEAIRQDHLNGLSYKAIAEKYHIDARTAKRYVEQNLPLSELEHRPFQSLLDPYKAQIREWIRYEQPSSRTVHEWLLSQGCECSYTLVNRFVRKSILEYEQALRSAYGQPIPTTKSIIEKACEEKKYVNNK